MGKMRQGHIEEVLGKKHRSGHMIERYKWSFSIRVDCCRDVKSKGLDQMRVKRFYRHVGQWVLTIQIVGKRIMKRMEYKI